MRVVTFHSDAKMLDFPAADFTAAILGGTLIARHYRIVYSAVGVQCYAPYLRPSRLSDDFRRITARSSGCSQSPIT